MLNKVTAFEVRPGTMRYLCSSMHMRICGYCDPLTIPLKWKLETVKELTLLYRNKCV